MSRELDHFGGRTNAKLQYAELTLQELRAHGQRGSGHDFQRAHHEAFLFHLLGVVDALLQELNVRYGCDLPLKEVKWKCLSERMERVGHTNAALTELKRLRKNGWLRDAREYRDHGTHRHHIPRIFDVGGDNRTVRFYPETGQPMRTDVLDTFADWLKRMKELVEEGRR
jgi:hypothetical protein